MLGSLFWNAESIGGLHGLTSLGTGRAHYRGVDSLGGGVSRVTVVCSTLSPPPVSK